MHFEKALQPDAEQALRYLGYAGAAPDESIKARLARGVEALLAVAAPLWTWRRLPLRDSEPVGATPFLAGEDICRHLAGCHAFLLLAVTLGAGVERRIRAAEATDMAEAVVLDALASALTEQYADEAEAILRAKTETDGAYLTGRYSPGYGDFSIAAQAPLLEELNAQRAIGLVVSGSGILLPRKSITAVLGVAAAPVAGRLAGCEHCALFEKCALRKEGKTCASKPAEQG